MWGIVELVVIRSLLDLPWFDIVCWLLIMVDDMCPHVKMGTFGDKNVPMRRKKYIENYCADINQTHTFWSWVLVVTFTEVRWRSAHLLCRYNIMITSMSVISDNFFVTKNTWGHMGTNLSPLYGDICKCQKYIILKHFFFYSFQLLYKWNVF